MGITGGRSRGGSFIGFEIGPNLINFIGSKDQVLFGPRVAPLLPMTMNGLCFIKHLFAKFLADRVDGVWIHNKQAARPPT